MNAAENPYLLIVDDDRLVLAVLASGLRDAGFNVAEADNGDEAILLAQEYKPALAILDMQMPGKSGLEVARYLADHTDTPFMFLTAYGDASLVEKAASHGAMGYLLKPLDVKQIVPSVRAVLARSNEMRTLRASQNRLESKVAATTDANGVDYMQIALGIFMERFGYTRVVAQMQMEGHAKNGAVTVAEFSRALVSGLDNNNRMK